MASLTVASRFDSLGEFGVKNVVTMRMHSFFKGCSSAWGVPNCEVSGESEEDRAEDGTPDDLRWVCNDRLRLAMADTIEEGLAKSTLCTSEFPYRVCCCAFSEVARSCRALAQWIHDWACAP